MEINFILEISVEPAKAMNSQSVRFRLFYLLFALLNLERLNWLDDLWNGKNWVLIFNWIEIKAWHIFEFLLYIHRDEKSTHRHTHTEQIYKRSHWKRIKRFFCENHAFFCLISVTLLEFLNEIKKCSDSMSSDGLLFCFLFHNYIQKCSCHWIIWHLIVLCAQFIGECTRNAMLRHS